MRRKYYDNAANTVTHSMTKEIFPENRGYTYKPKVYYKNNFGNKNKNQNQKHKL